MRMGAGISIRSASISGLLALFLGIGLGRMCYHVLVTPMVLAGWLTTDEAAYAGSANLLGYFVGALVNPLLVRRINRRSLVLLGLFGTAAFLGGSALPWGVYWLAFMRFLTGWGGSMLMINTPQLVLAGLNPVERKTQNSAVFTGIGIGAAVGGVLLPPIEELGPSIGWATLGGLGLLTAIGAALLLPKSRVRVPQAPVTRASKTRPVLLLTLAYFLDPVAFIPYVLFWGNYIEQELNYGAAWAGAGAVALGLSSLFGPGIMGGLSQRISTRLALFVAALLKLIALLGAWLLPVPAVLMLSSILSGAMMPATIGLTAQRCAELTQPNAYQATWRMLVLSIALGQALNSFGLSALYEYLGSYRPLFSLGVVAMTVAAALLYLAEERRPHLLDPT